MEFRALETISVVATAGGAVVGIALAAGGAGPWALIGNALAVSALSSVLVWRRSAWRPRLRFSVRSLRRLSGFASLLFAARVLAALQRSADRLLIGRYLGAPALGAYAVSSSIVAVPAARLVDPIRAVLFPALSRLQDSRSELARAWLRVTGLVVALVAPLLASLALAADEIVALALPQRWSESAPLLRILALAALAQLAGSMNAVVLTALGRLSVVVRVFGVTLLLSLVGFAVGRRYGVEGAAAGYAAATVLLTPLYVAITARSVRVPARALAAVYGPPTAGLVVMAAAVTAASRGALGGTSGAGPHLAFVAAGVALYAIVVLGSSAQLRSDVATVLSRR
jgi:PST family polysaccharide transporter